MAPASRPLLSQSPVPAVADPRLRLARPAPLVEVHPPSLGKASYVGLREEIPAVITYPPSIPLARLPTPLHECPNVGDLLRPGQRLWVKRDDETGCTTSGNKLRKLDFYAAEAQAQGADTLLTSGSALSNHCRTTAIVARQLGMDVGLLLEGREKPALDGNFLLMALVGATIRTLPEGAVYNPKEELQDMADKLRSEGRKPYIVPPAGTGELGVTAYVKAVEELKGQCAEIGLKPNAVTITVGSCSTYAGLVLGARAHDIGCPAIGLSISGKTGERSAKTRRLIDETTAFLGIEPCVADEDIHILDQYRLDGYGKTDATLYEFIHDVAKRTGLILDPVYTGKAMRGVLEEMRSGCLQQAKDVIFVHTGGVFGIYQKKKGFDLSWRTI
jgi:D-cysteine desulfhydrase family pyridoxal phosphate-dependent enzyme